LRLAQRIPVRINVDEAPTGVVLSAGMTATSRSMIELARQPSDLPPGLRKVREAPARSDRAWFVCADGGPKLDRHLR
jgi:hypothetical protein